MEATRDEPSGARTEFESPDHLDRAAGLSTAEAERRRVVDGPNELPRPSEPSLATRLFRHLVEPLSAILTVAGLVTGVVLDRVVEGAAIIAIVVINGVVATIQERRSATAVHALEQMVAPTARIRRDGRVVNLAAADLVRGDLVELVAGDRVPADLQLLSAHSLAADEAPLTGESWPAEKDADTLPPAGAVLAERSNEVFGGTLIVRGHGLGVVAATGSQTEIGRIATGLGHSTAPPLVAQLRTVAVSMSALAIAIGLAIIPIMWFRLDENRLANATLCGVALAIAAIPEGMATIVVTTLALGARRMADHGAIVRQLSAVDALGCTEVICADKTGTLTTGQLTVVDLAVVDGRTAEFWLGAVRCNDARDGAGDPVDLALLEASPFTRSDETIGTRTDERPYDAATRSMATLHQRGAITTLTLKGAPEVVLGRCRPGDDRRELSTSVDRFARQGLKTLAIAQRTNTSDLDADQLEPLGVVAFGDPLRSSAVQAVAECQQGGIRVVMATGDHLETATAIAAAAGIPTDHCVSGDQLTGLGETERRRALAGADIVARVDPRTKVDLVEAHRERGRVVAMTGDGVNDAPALQRADVGVALAGVGGTDVARAAAQLVVTDGDLGTITRAVREGRRIRRNLRTVVNYLVTGNLSEVLIVIGAVALFPELAIPLLPVQLLWVNLITDGLPALALGTDVPPGDPMASKPDGTPSLISRHQVARAAAMAALIATTVLATGCAAKALGWSAEAIRTELLLTLLAAHLVLAYMTRATTWTFESGWAANRSLLLAVGGSISIQLIAFSTPVGRSLLGLEPLPPAGWAMTAAAVLFVVAVGDAIRVVERARRS